MNSWSSVASSLSFANWFSDDESLLIGGGRLKGDAARPAGGGGRQTKSLLDTPDSAKPSLSVDAVLPPILVRGPGGHELDTDTTYQRSIRKAKVKYLLGLPLTSSEWRLPHAAAPSRPDYSRVIPAAKLGKLPKIERRSPAEQVAAARSSESLSHTSPRASKRHAESLPSLPAVERKAYASFVACCAVHERDYQHNDVRAVLTDYQFPGWCYGCRLQYERPEAAEADEGSYDPLRDRPVRVGGGYAYSVRALESGGCSGGGDQRDTSLPLLPSSDAAKAINKALSALDLSTIDRLPRLVRSVRGKHLHLLPRVIAWNEHAATEQQDQAQSGVVRYDGHSARTGRSSEPQASLIQELVRQPDCTATPTESARDEVESQADSEATASDQQERSDGGLTITGDSLRPGNADHPLTLAADSPLANDRIFSTDEKRSQLSIEPKVDSRQGSQSVSERTSLGRASKVPSASAYYEHDDEGEQTEQDGPYLSRTQDPETAQISEGQTLERSAAQQQTEEMQLETVQTYSRTSQPCSPAPVEGLAGALDMEDAARETAQNTTDQAMTGSPSCSNSIAASPSVDLDSTVSVKSTEDSDHKLEQERPATSLEFAEQNAYNKEAHAATAEPRLESQALFADPVETASSGSGTKGSEAQHRPGDQSAPTGAVPADSDALGDNHQDVHTAASPGLDIQSSESVASTNQRSLVELLHDAVQVSSWKPDAVTTTVVFTTAQQYQPAQILTPTVITIPPDQRDKADMTIETSVQTSSLVAVTYGEATMPNSKPAAADKPNAVENILPATNTSANDESHTTAEAVGGSPEKDAQPPDSRYGSLPARRRKPRILENNRSIGEALPAVADEALENDTITAVNHEGVITITNDKSLPETKSDVLVQDPFAATEAAAKRKPVLKKVARRKEKILSDKQPKENSEVQEIQTHDATPAKVAEPQAALEESRRDDGAAATQLGSSGSAPASAAAIPVKQPTEPPVAKRAGDTNASATVKPGAETMKRTASKVQRPRPPPVPAEKPNFMHLLSLGTMAEEPPTDFVSSPVEDASTSPEMEFVIHREPTTPEPTPPTPPPAEAPLEPPPVEPTPTLPKKELLPPPPPPVSVGPPPQVVKKRMRALKLFESRSRVVSLVQRRSEISPPTKRELRAGADPVDYLTKYCLINSDRLPYYERVFREVVTHQQARLNFTTHLTESATDQMSITTLESEPRKKDEKKAGPTEHQRQLLRAAAQLPALVPHCREPAINVAEFHSARVAYTLQRLQERYEQLVQAIERLEEEKVHALASAAREAYPEIFVADYKPQTGKRKKSPKPRKRSPSPEKTRRAKPVNLNDREVMERLSSAQKDNLVYGDKAIRGMTIRLERMEQQCEAAELRAAELEAERDEMENWAKQLFVQQEKTEKMPAEFRLSQSQFFNRLHPIEDKEMNLEELEYALQLINNHLITDKERKYIYHILNIPGSTRLSLKMFSCIAALSEKVHQLDPIVKKLINKLDYEALEIKMEACKDMFFLLADRSRQAGRIQLSDLSVELAAGGLSTETVHYIIGRLDFLSTGQVEYLDYLMYIPLFLEIHQKIVKEPLADRAQCRTSSAGK